MESNTTGAGWAKFLARKAEEKKAKFDAIHKYLRETNAQGYTRDDAMRLIYERKCEEEQRRRCDDHQQSPDTAG
jgi:hypothetical protein